MQLVGVVICVVLSIGIALEIARGRRASRALAHHLDAVTSDLRALSDKHGIAIIDGDRATELPAVRGSSLAPTDGLGIRGLVEGRDAWVVECRRPSRSRWGTIVGWEYDVRCGLRLGMRSPAPLLLKPQAPGVYATELLLGDITTESTEFNEAFIFTCGDHRFASDVIGPLMMAWLLDECRYFCFELRDELLLGEPPGTSLDVGDAEQWLAVMVGFANRIPRFVLEDHPAVQRDR